jgi:hypothetical protein
MHNRRGVLRTEIPIDPRASEAPSHGVPLMLYARSRAARAYEKLTMEVVQRVERRTRTQVDTSMTVAQSREPALRSSRFSLQICIYLRNN